MTTPAWIQPLTSEGGGAGLLGGKGESLARLTAAGFPVPEGFCVTTAAYVAYVGEHDLDALSDDPDGIARWFAERPIPAELARQILAAYADLGAPAVAVRSSATAEDSSAASFAGQLESVLDVSGSDALLAAVRRCWASLWTGRAVAYRTRPGVSDGGIAVAVVVQRLVPAEAAGILFTADPLMGATGTVQINAGWGLGDAVVAGEVTPDTFLLDATTGKVVARTVADKSTMTVRTPTGVADRAVPSRLRRRPSLTCPQAERLARVGLDIAALYETPVDVEWCRTGDELFVVQARPITTGGGAASDPWNDSRTTYALWTSTNVGEAIPDVLTPAAWSLVRVFLAGAMATSSIPGYLGYGRIGGRLYLNLTVMFGLAQVLGVSERRVRALTEDVFGRIPDEVPVPPLRASRLRVLRGTIPVAFEVLRRARRDITRLPAFVDQHPAACTRLRAAIARIDDPAELARVWREGLRPGLDDASWMLSAATRSSGSSLVTTQQRLRTLVGDADANALLSGLGGAGGDLASLDLMRGLADVAAGTITRVEFNQTYGHRGPHEFEISVPRPGEDPGWLDEQLAQWSTAGAAYRARLAAQERAREAAWARLRQTHPAEAGRMWRRVAHWGEVARNRERARSEVVRYFWVLRAYALRAGELTGIGDDVFFLDAEQIAAVLDGAPVDPAVLSAARRNYDAYRELPSYPPLIVGPFDPFRWAADPDRRADVFADGTDLAVRDQIRGFPGSAGVVEGTVRVIREAADGSELQPGEVLVTTVTNVGWTPLFPRAGAVVTDIGAPLSHAAIVARELGIPAVVGCGNATALLRTGDRVRVDGSAGLVERLSRAAP